MAVTPEMAEAIARAHRVRDGLEEPDRELVIQLLAVAEGYHQSMVNILGLLEGANDQQTLIVNMVGRLRGPDSAPATGPAPTTYTVMTMPQRPAPVAPAPVSPGPKLLVDGYRPAPMPMNTPTGLQMTYQWIMVVVVVFLVLVGVQFT